MEAKNFKIKSIAVYYGYRRNIKARFLIKKYYSMRLAIKFAKKLSRSTHSVYTILDLNSGLKTLVGTTRNSIMKVVKNQKPIVAVAPVRRFVTDSYLATHNVRRIA